MTARPSSALFAARLARAYRLLAHGPAEVPINERDQLDAAGRDARLLHDRMGALLPIFEPARPWHQRVDPSPSVHTRALLLAAVLGCLDSVCCHLRKGGPQPAFVNLALRRVDCRRCAATVRRPAPDEGDCCDVCGARGVMTFVPFAAHRGPALVIGDACPTCAGVLGIVQEARAAGAPIGLVAGPGGDVAGGRCRPRGAVGCRASASRRPRPGRGQTRTAPVLLAHRIGRLDPLPDTLVIPDNRGLLPRVTMPGAPCLN
jgi:hypothetical protein